MNKKYLALALAALTALGALTACGGKQDEPSAPDQSVADDTVTTPDTPDTDTPDTGDGVVITPPGGDQPATMPDEGVDDSFGGVDAGGEDAGSGFVEPDAALSDIVDAIYEKVDPGYSVETVGVDLTDDYRLTYYTGLTDGSVLSAAVASEPMISSQAYSLIVARVAEGQDAESVAREMLNGVNPAKWVCVSADDMTAVASDDLILLVMVNEYDDGIASADFADAFIALYGGNTVSK